MTAPEGQKEAPKGGETLRGAKTNKMNGANVGMFPPVVKGRACYTWCTWPTWLGWVWLCGKGVRK